MEADPFQGRGGVQHPYAVPMRMPTERNDESDAVGRRSPRKFGTDRVVVEGTLARWNCSETRSKPRILVRPLWLQHPHQEVPFPPTASVRVHIRTPHRECVVERSDEPIPPHARQVRARSPSPLSSNFVPTSLRIGTSCLDPNTKFPTQPGGLPLFPRTVAGSTWLRTRERKGGDEGRPGQHGPSRPRDTVQGARAANVRVKKGLEWRKKGRESERRRSKSSNRSRGGKKTGKIGKVRGGQASGACRKLTKINRHE